MKRSTIVLMGLGLVAALLPPTPVAHAGGSPLPACTSPTMTKCVVSVKHDGTEIDYPSGKSSEFTVTAFEIAASAPSIYRFYASIDRNDDDGDPFDLNPADTFEIVMRTGDVFPAETFARGKNVTVTRGGNATDGYKVAFEMQPVRMAWNGCGPSGGCGTTAGELSTGYWEAWVDDLEYVTDPDDRAAMRGFDLSSNADWISSPLQLDFATNSIVLDVANSHFEPDGTTVVGYGRAEFRLPFAMLNRLYNVDDPSTLTASAFRITTGGGSPTVSVTVGTSDVDVDITNISFSKRKLKIKGNTRPLKPRNLEVERVSPSKAKFRFDKALARGSKVRGYLAKCKRDGDIVRASAERSPVVMDNLQDKGYDCWVRAKSFAGLGRKATKHLPRA